MARRTSTPKIKWLAYTYAEKKFDDHSALKIVLVHMRRWANNNFTGYY